MSAVALSVPTRPLRSIVTSQRRIRSWKASRLFVSSARRSSSARCAASRSRAICAWLRELRQAGYCHGLSQAVRLERHGTPDGDKGATTSEASAGDDDAARALAIVYLIDRKQRTTATSRLVRWLRSAAALSRLGGRPVTAPMATSARQLILTEEGAAGATRRPVAVGAAYVTLAEHLLSRREEPAAVASRPSQLEISHQAARYTANGRSTVVARGTQMLLAGRLRRIIEGVGACPP